MMTRKLTRASAIPDAGPHAPLAPTGEKMSLPVRLLLPLMCNLVEGFPNFTMNVDRVPFTQNADGSWSTTIINSGTHNGPYVLPGCPVIEPTGKHVVSGAEKFTFYINESGAIQRKIIAPLTPGPAGPPFFYVAVGGHMPYGNGPAQ